VTWNTGVRMAANRMRLARSSRLGPAALLAAGLLFLAPVTIDGHDPGLSSLVLKIEPARIVATLSLAAPDAHLAAGRDRNDLAASATAFALGAIELWVDGIRLDGRDEASSTTDDGGTVVVVAFAVVPGQVLTVRSHVPSRLAPGHRQLLTISRGGGFPNIERMLTAQSETFALDSRMQLASGRSAAAFLALGISHILAGYDHLLFLAALLLGQRRLRDVVSTITAFTVAHSLTLGAAVLGLVRAPGWIVEPAIAASIVFVGVENLVRHQHAIAARWRVTFAFGLVHGFGFAGALDDLGIGGMGSGIAAALASFNLGVEAGQVAAALVLWPVVQRLNTAPAARLRLAPACSLLVIAMGAYWFLERI
jgi:hydrogenase/urease accessory protein HupE